MGLMKKKVRRISQLKIDADKDWQVKGITNLPELAAGMQRGEMLVRSDNVIVKLTPGFAGSRLTTQGVAALPIWTVG